MSDKMMAELLKAVHDLGLSIKQWRAAPRQLPGSPLPPHILQRGDDIPALPEGQGAYESIEKIEARLKARSLADAEKELVVSSPPVPKPSISEQIRLQQEARQLVPDESKYAHDSLQDAKDAVPETTKRGVCLWRFGQHRLKDIAPNAWYYNGTPHANDPTDRGFIPMISGKKDDYEGAYSALSSARSNAVMGFYEPDLEGEGFLTPRDAVLLWQKVCDAAGDKFLGSPVVSSDFKWLDEFVALAPRRPDFICLHSYPDLKNPHAAAGEVVQLVKDTAARYNAPVWLTEVGAATLQGHTPNEAAVVEFVRVLIPQLEALAVLDHYAWFFETALSGFEHSGLWTLNGQLTSTGVAYKEAR